MQAIEISERFDVDDIRKIREYNSMRHVNMTPEEIVKDTKNGSERVMKMLDYYFTQGDYYVI
jgi:hypothetical protein